MLSIENKIDKQIEVMGGFVEGMEQHMKLITYLQDISVKQQKFLDNMAEFLEMKKKGL